MTKGLLTKMFNKLELIGPYAGKLLDTQLFLYELKNMRPPLRLYYKHNIHTNELYILEFEMKHSQETQSTSISRIKKKLKS